MNNTAVSDTSGALPPVTKSEIDGNDGPAIKISVSYGPSLHEIHLPAQSTFGANEITPNPEDSTPNRKKNPNWTTEQNLVLLTAWIKYRTSSVVGRNQKGETYWGRIAEYCNEHCSFDPPRDGVSCRNHYNYMNKILGKWIGAYDRAKSLQGSGLSENDILAKAQELYASGKNGHFNLMAEWYALRNQPRYGSQVGGNTGSGSSGSKRSHESDACGSNSVGSSARPIGREAAKKMGKKKSKEAALEVVNNEWAEIKKNSRRKSLNDWTR